MFFKKNQNSSAYSSPSFAQNANRSKLIALVVLICFIVLMLVVAALTSKKDLSKAQNPASTNTELKKVDFRLGGSRASIYIPNGFELDSAQPLKFSGPDSQTIQIRKLEYTTEEKFEDLTKRLTLNIEGHQIEGLAAKQETLYQKNILLITNKSSPKELDYYIYQGSYLWEISLTLNQDSKSNLKEFAPQIITSIERQKNPSEDYLRE